MLEDQWGQDEGTSRPTIILHSFKLNTYPLNRCGHAGESFSGLWVDGVLVWVEGETEAVDELVESVF